MLVRGVEYSSRVRKGCIKYHSNIGKASCYTLPIFYYELSRIFGPFTIFKSRTGTPIDEGIEVAADIMKKRLIIVVLIAVVNAAAAAYLWFREVPLRVRISDIALDPQAYEGKLVEAEGYLIRYEFGFWAGYGLYSGWKIALSGYEQQIVNSDWVGPFDQYLDEYVVIIGRFEYFEGVDSPNLWIEISTLSMSS